ncbi:MAG TPA: flagellar hook-basal body complex protein [Methylomirabilota bacterium]|nr:flagellar hook-basal body complex protein [Methylomirabilota bacterium]
MIRSLTSGVSGLQQHQVKLDVIGNNIANANTVAFKGGRTEFEDAFSQSLDEQTQIGSGVTTGSVTNLFSQGTVTKTGRPDDMAVAGEGFFVVRNPQTGEEFVTRAGDFRRSSDGYLTTGNGYRLQGFTNADMSARGDIRITAEEAPAGAAANATVAAYNVEGDGRIRITLNDGTKYYRGQVLLQSFSNPNALRKEGNNLYSGIANAGPLGGAAPESRAPGSNGLGSIAFEHLEMSNVDLTGEFASLISTQRGFQANARIITTSDEILQEIVNLKR